MTVLIALAVVAGGVVIGALSALFGIGGGGVMVPFMVLLLAMDQHTAEGTSLLVIIPTAIAGVLAHRRQDYVSFKHAAFLALGGVGGAYAGAAFAQEIEAETLQAIFGVFVLITGARLIVRGRQTIKLAEKEEAA